MHDVNLYKAVLVPLFFVELEHASHSEQQAFANMIALLP